MRQLFLLLLSFFLQQEASAFILPEKYISGREICKIHEGDLEKEIGHYIKVPKYYDQLDLGETEIYAFTTKPFNEHWPSVIYFTGGPGNSARSGLFQLDKINVIFFEQRGISCSRPQNKEDFLNPNFYSSKNTAKDALKILDFFKIKKATIYGQSYGTMPATIFGSFFPNRTQSVILEGVIFKGDQTLWKSSRKKNLLQNYFNQLPAQFQERIIDLGQSILPANWFFKVGNMMLYVNDGLWAYTEFLKSVFELETDAVKGLILSFYPDETLEENFDFGDVTMGMIACQEISMNDKNHSHTMVFNSQRVLEYDQENVDKVEYCDPLQLSTVKAPYDANNFPITIPVFYLLGENDGATDLDQGLSHFHHVAKGEKHLLVMEKGGHLPNLGLLKDNRQCVPEQSDDQCKSLQQNVLQMKLFSSIIQNGELNQLVIEEFNQIGPLKWN